MITVYVKADNITREIKDISLTPLRLDYFKASLNDTIINLAELNHYFLIDDGKNTYHIEYDLDKYEEIVKEKEKEQKIEEGKKKLKEIQLLTTLEYASDEDAYIMKYLYDAWCPDTDYEEKDRRLHNDVLYKCKKAHTSQKEYTPDLIPALWDIINGDTTKGTIDNPIIVPETVSSMVYVKGKYYLEGNTIYLMNRVGMNDGEEIALTFKPSQLVGHYFEKIEK